MPWARQCIRLKAFDRDEAMKRTLLGMAEAGEPLLKQALAAIRAFNEAEAEGRPEEELSRLRLEADHLYETVINYQLYKAGNLGESTH